MTKVDEIEIPLYSIELVRERNIPFNKIASIEDAAAIAHKVLDRSPVEKLMVMYVGSGWEIVGAEIVAIGQMERCNISMSELFRGALLAGVPRMVMAHNHPTGPSTPSQPDIRLTELVVRASAIIGIELYDHIVVSPDGSHTSIWEYAQAEARKRMNSPFDFGKKMSPEDIDAAKKRLIDMFKDFALNPMVVPPAK